MALQELKHPVAEALPHAAPNAFGALRGAGAAVLKVTANWCGPCKKIHPEFLNLCCAYPHVKSLVLDIDAAQNEGGDAQQLLDLLAINALPTFILFRKGVEQSRICGSAPGDLRELFAASAPTSPCPASTEVTIIEGDELSCTLGIASMEMAVENK